MILFQCRKCRDIKELNMATSCSCAGEFRSLAMANFLLDSFPSLEKTSSWMLNMNQEDTRAFRARVKEYRERGIKIEYKEW